MNEKECSCNKCVKCLEKKVKSIQPEPVKTEKKTLFIKTKESITSGVRG